MLLTVVTHTLFARVSIAGSSRGLMTPSGEPIKVIKKGEGKTCKEVCDDFDLSGRFWLWKPFWTSVGGSEFLTLAKSELCNFELLCGERPKLNGTFSGSRYRERCSALEQLPVGVMA